jgi:hypothetical protein
VNKLLLISNAETTIEGGNTDWAGTGIEIRAVGSRTLERSARAGIGARVQGGRSTVQGADRGGRCVCKLEKLQQGNGLV